MLRRINTHRVSNFSLLRNEKVNLVLTIAVIFMATARKQTSYGIRKWQSNLVDSDSLLSLRLRMG